MNADRSTLRTAALIAALAPSLALAQAQPQGAAANPNAGMLTPATTNAAAVSELRASLDRYNLWTTRPSVEHAKQALALEPTFGLARTTQAILVGGPTAAAEFQRAATEASTGSAVEALLALGAREVNAGRAPTGRRLSQLAAELAPNDRQVATWRAIQLPDTVRVNAFRDVANRFPDYPGAKMWLSYYLTPAGLDSIIKANADEALRVAFEAVRLAPNESGTHTAVAHVLVYNGRFDEAKGHLGAATKMTPVSEYAYELQAQIAAVENNFPVLRAALDTAAAATPGIGAGFTYRRARALVALSESNPQGALTELSAIERDAEAIGAKPQAALTHLFMAAVAGATRDTAGVEQHLTAARMLDSAQAVIADYAVTTYSISGQAAKARRALEDYIRVGGPRPNLSPAVNATRTTNVHRMTGLVLIAEKKPQEAIAELRQGGNNPYATLGIIEAYKLQKNTKQADAERTDFFQRKNFSFNSTATPIIRYRAKK
jgi:tetratricopeptide (TPR) repeat protein